MPGPFLLGFAVFAASDTARLRLGVLAGRTAPEVGGRRSHSLAVGMGIVRPIVGSHKPNDPPLGAWMGPYEEDVILDPIQKVIMELLRIGRLRSLVTSPTVLDRFERIDP